MRLKRYRLDSLATGQEAGVNETRPAEAWRHSNVWARREGALPLLGAPLEIDDSFVVVTAWPRGESLGYLIETGELDTDAAEELFRELVRAVASIHATGIVHRNITPDCAHLQPDGSIVLTDFDYARLPDHQTPGGTVVGHGHRPRVRRPRSDRRPLQGHPGRRRLVDRQGRREVVRRQPETSP